MAEKIAFIRWYDMFSVRVQLTNENSVPGHFLVYDAESSDQAHSKTHTAGAWFSFVFIGLIFTWNRQWGLMTHLSLWIKTVCSNTRSPGMPPVTAESAWVHQARPDRGPNNFSLIRNLMHWGAQRSHNIWPGLECKQSISASPPPPRISQSMSWVKHCN